MERFGFDIFVGSNVIVESFRPFWHSLLGAARWNFCLKLLLETKLESESLEHLIAFLAFVVQKLWSKNNKLYINP